MKIAMIGSGYVGLVSGACFADFGHIVTCIDKNADKIALLKKGNLPIFEPGLADLIVQNIQAERLFFSTNPHPAGHDSDVVFLAVGTPSRRGDGYADLSYIFEAVEEIAPSLKPHSLLITKSTVPVGTGDEIEALLHKLRPEADIVVVSNPEFLREGAAISDFKRPDRIVVGLPNPQDSRARSILQEIYRPLSLNAAPLLFTSRRTSELIKYASNAFLATKITFINEIADLCEVAGADVQDVAKGIGLDKRIGSKFLHPGPGYGGSCFPKDTRALLQTARDLGATLDIVETVVTLNEARKFQMAQKIIGACEGSVAGKTIAILGLAFKPNTDDMRESPALDIISALCQSGAHIKAHDPESMDHARNLITHEIEFCATPYLCAQEADALVIITEWDAFRALDLDRIHHALKKPVLIDLRNIYTPEEMKRKGFYYVSLGRS